MNDNSKNLFNELAKSLDSLLDSDIKLCSSSSSIVICYLKQLLSICSSMQYFDISSCQEILDELKEGLEKEYKQYEQLFSYSKDRLFLKLDAIINTEHFSLDMLRHRNKLQATKNIFMGLEISSKELNLGNIPDMRFDIFSVIVSFIHLKTFKSVKNKIDGLSCQTKQDNDFVTELLKVLSNQLLLKSCYNDLLEILTIYNDIDIDKMPDINFNLIGDKLKKIYHCDNVDECVSEILFKLAVGDISVMCQEGNLVNSPKSVFDYLYFTTRFEIILTYMDKNSLVKLYEYCKNMKFNNQFIYNDVNNKIRRIMMQ